MTTSYDYLRINAERRIQWKKEREEEEKRRADLAEAIHSPNQKRLLLGKCGFLINEKMPITNLGDGRTRIYIRHDSGSKRQAAIIVDGRIETLRVCRVLHQMYNIAEGQVWPHIGALLLAKFEWPAWIRYQRAIASEAARLRNGAPPLRQSSKWDERYVTPSSYEYQKFWALYAKSLIRPLAEEDVERFFDRVRLFEAEPMKLENFFNMARENSAIELSKELRALSDSSDVPSEGIIAYALKQKILNWQNLQDFRTCYAEQTRALKRWLADEYVGDGASDFYSQLT